MLTTLFSAKKPKLSFIRGCRTPGDMKVSMKEFGIFYLRGCRASGGMKGNLRKLRFDQTQASEPTMSEPVVSKFRSSQPPMIKHWLSGVMLALAGMALTSMPVQAALVKKDMDLSLDPEQHTIEGRLTVELPAGTYALRLDPRFNLQAVDLESFAPQAIDPESFSPQAIDAKSFASQAPDQPLYPIDTVDLHGHEPQVINPPAHTLQASDRVAEPWQLLPTPGAGRYQLVVPAPTTISLAWNGVLAARPDAESTAFLGPGGGFLPAFADWYPHILGVHEFTLDLTLRTPAGQRAVGSGSLQRINHDQTNGILARYHHPQTDNLTVASGPWVSRERKLPEITLETLFPAHLDATWAETYLNHIETYLQDFVERAGPYPYRSFTVATSPLPVGYAFPGFTLIGERVVALPFMLQTSLAHELLHSWWGTGVRVDYSKGNWSEALTTLMADYDLDVARGTGGDTRLRWLLDLNWLPASEEFPIVDFQGGNQGPGRIIGYNRAAFVLKMLRDEIGDEAFTTGVRQFNENYRFRQASWQHLLDALSQATELDVAAWAKPWLEQTGLPELKLTNLILTKTEAETETKALGADAAEAEIKSPGIGETESKAAGEANAEAEPMAKTRWQLSGELHQVHTTGIWPLTVPLKIELASGAVVWRRQPLNSAHVAWTEELSEPARSIAIDPNYEVLRRLDHPPVIFRSATLDPELRLGATEPELLALLTPLVSEATLRVPALSPGEPLSASQPTLLIGTTDPIIRWAQPVLADNASLTALARRGHARMLTLPGTRVAIISADDRSALPALVRSLRHQGHRSYVIQDTSGRTIESGLWPHERKDSIIHNADTNTNSNTIR